MNVIFLGPPGAGKGTIAAEIKGKLNLEHLSTGDMLRSEIKQGTEMGKMAKSYIDKGDLVPDQVIIDMVAEKLKNAEGGILFDGFPRTVEQAKALDNIATIDAVINLSTTVDVIIDRICSRKVCKSCGAVYNTHVIGEQAECDKCHGELYTRPDDNEETVRNRFEVYEKSTAPLVGYYEEKGIVTTIEANQSVEAVAAECMAALTK